MKLFTTLALAVIGVSVIWLLTKMSRTEAADLRLTVLGLAIVAALIAIAAGTTRRRGPRGRP
jgi:hypothetical protein